jgi:hypothetical protein
VYSGDEDEMFGVSRPTLKIHTMVRLGGIRQKARMCRVDTRLIEGLRSALKERGNP